MPNLLQPRGADPKGSAPFYCFITDARFTNKLYFVWGPRTLPQHSSAER